MPKMARASAVGLSRVTRLALVAVLLSACASGGPGATASPDAAEATPFDPGQIAAIDGANLLTRGARDPRPGVSPDEVASVARADADFALDLYRELAEASDANLVIGQHSIWTALSMVWAGARGQTASEMADVLHFDRPSEDVTPLLNALDLALLSRNEAGAVDLRFANQVFAEPGLPLLEEYLTTLTRAFGAPLAELTFGDPEAARKVINGWAADRTNDRIEELFPEGTITPQTRLVLCNAVSMDAAWTYLFDSALTTNEPFRRADGAVLLVPTMHFNLYLPLLVEDDLQAVELAYGKGDLSMVVILPEDLGAFNRDLDAERLQRIFDAITDQGIHLSLPKFSFSSDVALDEALQELGIRSAYGPTADFSGMTGEPGLFLDTVQHEAFIEVDEEGTKAHAATGAAMAVSHGPTITVDRPFFFVIRDRQTGAILFLGRVTDPSPQ
jgi:serpin B